MTLGSLWGWKDCFVAVPLRCFCLTHLNQVHQVMRLAIRRVRRGQGVPPEAQPLEELSERDLVIRSRPGELQQCLDEHPAGVVVADQEDHSARLHVPNSPGLRDRL